MRHGINRSARPKHGMAPGQRGLDPVGQWLVRRGHLSSRSLFDLDARIKRTEVNLSDALRRSTDMPEADIAIAAAEVTGTTVLDPLRSPPDPTLIKRFGAADCARYGVLPWRRSGGNTVVLTSRPDTVHRVAPQLAEALGPISLAIATESAIATALNQNAATELVTRAETRVPPQLSCRGWNPTLARWLTAATLLGLAAALWMAPGSTVLALTIWAVSTLVLTSGLKAAALVHFLRMASKGRGPATPPRLLRRPVVSILVPLYREREIAAHLLERLKKIDYPRELLEICLVLEADDAVTRATISATTLPPWFRAVMVPRGTLKTKPRALNYALDFARGSIIGIYDAEDAPAPDQIERVVARFAAAPGDVACLQGVLDYYNARTNWLSRCFTLEYATWFRVMLPGLQRLGLVIPLGGTTLFMRRDVLEELGGWDAHNVTEDADLGLRLARAGYRTELIESVTEEEANCRPWPWIKQRSRWLKGYGLTYAVHMRRPLQLWRELGAWRFLGVQTLFLGSLSQVLLAPLLWSFWAFPLGLPHPLQGMISTPSLWAIGGVFFACEALNIVTAALAVRSAGKPELMGWAPSLHLYFPLAAIAAYKGMLELMTRPFYWDKTAHGVYLPQAEKAANKVNRRTTGRPRRLRRRV